MVNINYPGRGENQTLCCKCKQTLKGKRTQVQWSERFFFVNSAPDVCGAVIPDDSDYVGLHLCTDWQPKSIVNNVLPLVRCKW